MKLDRIAKRPDLETLTAAIAHSPIVVAEPLRIAPLPAGFDEVDRAILRWIATESRRYGRSFPRI
jgi:hypothetical protein